MSFKIWHTVFHDYCLHPPSTYSPKENINGGVGFLTLLVPWTPCSLVKPVDLFSASYS